MKVYIMVDFEGIAGMIEWDDYVTDTPFNQEKRSRMRRILTGEVNAAIEGVLASGVKEVLIWDSHGPSNNCNNIYFEDLNPHAEIIIGWKGLPAFFPLLDKTFSAGLYIGGHAMEGTKKAILPHTKTNINNKNYGEVGKFGVMCGWFGLPLIFVSGDKATIEEVKRDVPNIEYVITKEAFSPYSARVIAPKKVRDLIREGTETAIKRIKEIEPINLQSPYVVKTGKGEIKGNDFFEVYNEVILSSSIGKSIGTQDVEPERSRIGKKCEEWGKHDSFLGS